MKFEEALAAMRQKKKVKLPDWQVGFIKIKEFIVDEDNQVIDIAGEHILYDSWEIVEDEK
jgi:hypothetical protein